MTDNIQSELQSKLTELQPKYVDNSEYTIFFALCDEVLFDEDTSMSHDDVVKINAVSVPRDNICNDLKEFTTVDLPENISNDIGKIFDDCYNIHQDALISNESEIYDNYCDALQCSLKNLQPTYDQSIVQHLCKKWLNPTILQNTINREFNEHSFRSGLIEQLNQWLTHIQDHPGVKISIGIDHKYYGLVMHFDSIFDFGQTINNHN